MASRDIKQAVGEMERYLNISRLGIFIELAERRMEELRAKGALAGQDGKEARELEGFVSIAGTVLRNKNDIAQGTLTYLIKKARELGLKQEV